MKTIELVGVARELPAPDEHPDTVPLELLDELAAALARIFRVSCHLREEKLDASFAFDPVRNQYSSTVILERLDGLVAADRQGDRRVLAVTALDLYVPILTFVFGEAQLAGRCAVVSFHRLREDFYGLPLNQALLDKRLTKEAVHELGHTFGLRHCSNWGCVMASSHSVARLDLKTPYFCPACQRQVAMFVPALPR